MDSSSILGMLQIGVGQVQRFTGTGVSKIKIQINVLKEWYWIEGEDIATDLGIRDTFKSKDLGPGSHYQEGAGVDETAREQMVLQ
jgi:hypothetical protein